jgi:hypothetical protein
MTIEIYKDVVGYEGIYQVSNLGNVKRVLISWGVKGRDSNNYVIKAFINSSGYYRVGLTKNNKHSNHFIHRLVAKAFIENKNNYPIINHINGIKTDNKVDNLEWCTASQNVRHAIKMGLMTFKKGYFSNQDYSKLCKKIIDIETGVIYPSVVDLSLKINVPRSTIQYWLTYQKNNQSNYRYL